MIGPVHRAAACLLLLAAATAGQAASAREIWQRASPAVVYILATRAGVAAGTVGTGFLVDATGGVLTNRHVVTVAGEPAETVLVYRKPAELSGDRARDLRDPLPARLIRSDAGLDLALLQLPAGAYAPVLRLAPGRAAPGEPTLAIGHPGHGSLWSLSAGMVSGFLADHGGHSGKDVYQTDATVNPGGSGGPLLDEDGRVIGVNSFVVRSDDAGLVLEGLQFAITSQVALRFLAASSEPAVAAAAESAAPLPAVGDERRHDSMAVELREPGSPPAAGR